MLYHLCFADPGAGPRQVADFLLIAGEIGSLLNFTLTVVELDIDLDGDPITSCIVDPTDRAPGRSTTPKQRRGFWPSKTLRR